MQREIEALLTAYLADRNKETQLIQDLLTALAVGVSARQRMVRDMAAALGSQVPVSSAISAAPSGPNPRATADSSNAQGPAGGDITSAIQQLRVARGPSPAAH